MAWKQVQSPESTFIVGFDGLSLAHPCPSSISLPIITSRPLSVGHSLEEAGPILQTRSHYFNSRQNSSTRSLGICPERTSFPAVACRNFSTPCQQRPFTESYISINLLGPYCVAKPLFLPRVLGQSFFIALNSPYY